MSLDDLIQREALSPLSPRKQGGDNEKSALNQQDVPIVPAVPDITRDTANTLDGVLAKACEGLPLEPAALRAELSAEDVAGIEAGTYPLEMVQAFAELSVIPQRNKASADGKPWTADDIDEATVERQAIVEQSTDAQTAEAIARAAREFYAHIFGEAQRTGCCRAPLGAYCKTGARLKDEYEKAAADGVPFAEMPAAYQRIEGAA